MPIAKFMRLKASYLELWSMKRSCFSKGLWAALLAWPIASMALLASSGTNAPLATPSPAASTALASESTNQNAGQGSSTKGLYYAAAPAKGPQIVLAALGPGISASSAGSPINIEPPLPMYDATRSSNPLAAGNIDSVAKLEQYYYSVTQGGRQIKYVLVIVDPATGAAKLGTMGFTAWNLVMDALQKVSVLPQVQAGSYEARILRFNAHGGTGTVLWLKSASGGDNLIYPVQTWEILQPGKLYSETEFLTTVRALEKKDRDFIKAQNNAQATIITDNQRKATNSADMAATRLKNLQTALDTALADLRQAPEPAKSVFSQAIVDIEIAQADVTQGVDYLKSHPEADALHPRTLVVAEQNEDFGYPWQTWTGTMQIVALEKDNPGFPLAGACTALDNSLKDFLGNPAQGIPALGEMGSHRDTIMRDTAMAENALIKSATDYTGLSSAAYRMIGSELAAHSTPMIAPMNPTGQPGSISGRVVRTDGQPAAGAIISFLPVDSLNYGMQPSGSRPNGGLRYSLPGTLSSENGSFTINNLSAGFYAIAAGNSNWAVIEVKADAETRLDAPIVLRRMAGGGG